MRAAFAFAVGGHGCRFPQRSPKFKGMSGQKRKRASACGALQDEAFQSLLKKHLDVATLAKQLPLSPIFQESTPQEHFELLEHIVEVDPFFLKTKVSKGLEYFASLALQWKVNSYHKLDDWARQETMALKGLVMRQVKLGRSKTPLTRVDPSTQRLALLARRRLGRKPSSPARPDGGLASTATSSTTPSSSSTSAMVAAVSPRSRIFAEYGLAVSSPATKAEEVVEIVSSQDLLQESQGSEDEVCSQCSRARSTTTLTVECLLY